MLTFSFTRLQLLIKTWWLEHKFSFLLGIAGLLALQILTGCYWLYLTDYTYQKYLQLYLTISLLFVQTQRVSNSFKVLHKPATKAQWLLVPATPEEKFFAVFFWQTIVFMLCGMGLTMITEEILVNIAETRYLNNPLNYSFYGAPNGENIFSSAYFNADNHFLKKLWGIWFGGQFLYYWGAIHFKRGVYINTGLIIILSTYLFGHYVNGLKNIFFPKNSNWYSVWNLKIPINNDQNLDYSIDTVWNTVLNLGLGAICIYLLFKSCISLISEKAVKN